MIFQTNRNAGARSLGYVFGVADFVVARFMI
jgi:hypothetical protein